MTSAVNSPTPGSVRSAFDPRVGLSVGVQLAVDPVDQRRQAVDHRQAVGNDLPRRRRQVQLGQPAATRPGPVARAAVIAVVGGHRVDPVAQLGAQADQADPVPQQRAELADPRRGKPGLGQQVGAQQLRQNGGVDLVFSELCKRDARLRCRTRSRWLHRHSKPAALTSKSSSEEKLGGQLSTVRPVSVAIRLTTWLLRPGNRHLPDSPTIGRRDG